MKTNVLGQYIEIAFRRQELIERQLDRLARLLQDRVVLAEHVLSQRQRGFGPEFVLHAHGNHVLHGEWKGLIVTQAIGTAVDIGRVRPPS